MPKAHAVSSANEEKKQCGAGFMTSQTKSVTRIINGYSLQSFPARRGGVEGRGQMWWPPCPVRFLLGKVRMKVGLKAHSPVVLGEFVYWHLWTKVWKATWGRPAFRRFSPGNPSASGSIRSYWLWGPYGASALFSLKTANYSGSSLKARDLPLGAGGLRGLEGPVYAGSPCSGSCGEGSQPEEALQGGVARQNTVELEFQVNHK